MAHAAAQTNMMHAVACCRMHSRAAPAAALANRCPHVCIARTDMHPLRQRAHTVRNAEQPASGSFPSMLSTDDAGRCAHTARAAASDAGPASSDVLRVSLPTKEAQQSIRFALARAGRETAVIINRLTGGSAAAEAGVRPGQRLLSISDPMSATGMWDLNDRPSVRFVRDALAMRSSDRIDLVLSRDSVYAPGAATQSQMSIDEIDTGAEIAAASGGGADDEPIGAGAATSVSQQLAQQYQEREGAVAAQRSAFERRQQRRREFFEKESARDDGSFFAVTAAVMLLPALAILAAAFFSGYLDRLSDTYTITR